MATNSSEGKTAAQGARANYFFVRRFRGLASGAARKIGGKRYARRRGVKSRRGNSGLARSAEGLEPRVVEVAAIEVHGVHGLRHAFGTAAGRFALQHVGRRHELAHDHVEVRV